MSRLVPMPAHKPRAGTPRKATPAIAPSGLKSWHTFAFLIVTALIWYWLKWPIIVFGTMAAIVLGLSWLDHHFPRTMFVITTIIGGLLSRR
ncbi:hypothetical protein [Bradyrhizobium sp. USDA 4508]